MTPSKKVRIGGERLADLINEKPGTGAFGQPAKLAQVAAAQPVAKQVNAKAGLRVAAQHGSNRDAGIGAVSGVGGEQQMNGLAAPFDSFAQTRPSSSPSPCGREAERVALRRRRVKFGRGLQTLIAGGAATQQSRLNRPRCIPWSCLMTTPPRQEWQFGRIYTPDEAWLAKAAPEPILDP